MYQPDAQGGEEVIVGGGAAPLEHNFPASPPFTFLAHAERWDVFITPKGAEILPVLKALGHTPGVSNVEQVTLQDGSIVGDPTRAIATKRSREAFIEVPATWTIVAFGQTYRGYVHRYRGKKGAIHLDRWTRLYKVGTTTHRQRDEAGYYAFLRRVRDDLLGGAPDAAILAGLHAKLQHQLSTARANRLKSPIADGSIGLLEAKMAAFRGSDIAPRPVVVTDDGGGLEVRANPTELHLEDDLAPEGELEPIVRPPADDDVPVQRGRRGRPGGAHG